ncbi:hypothetical protein BATDEDRAFT_31428, partial [Batrachochytrium dendrobatidis JAM81]
MYVERHAHLSRCSISSICNVYFANPCGGSISQTSILWSNGGLTHSIGTYHHQHLILRWNNSVFLSNSLFV